MGNRLNAGAKTILVFASYLVGSALTFGYIYNHVDRDNSAFGAVFWPLYWVFRAGIEITKSWNF